MGTNRAGRSVWWAEGSGICSVTSRPLLSLGWLHQCCKRKGRGCYKADESQSRGIRGLLIISWNWCFSLRGKQSRWLTENALFRLSDPGTHFLSLICQYCLDLSLRGFHALLPNTSLLLVSHFIFQLLRAPLAGSISFCVPLLTVVQVLIWCSGSVAFMALAMTLSSHTLFFNLLKVTFLFPQVRQLNKSSVHVLCKRKHLSRCVLRDPSLLPLSKVRELRLRDCPTFWFSDLCALQ